MPKVSVIIPVYNANKYLERCLDSVKNQTLKDIEIICVDDCSIDNSLEILNKYAKNDKRFKIIHHNINKGESGARNTGINSAKGEYIAFVDNDDTIDLNFLEKLYDLAKTNNLDIVKGNSNEYDCNGNLINNNFNQTIIENNKEKLCFVTHWWSAIYKTDLIKNNNIKLPEDLILGGDIVFLSEALILANKFDIINDVFYHQYHQINSGDSIELSIEKIKSSIQAYKKIIENTVNNKEKLTSFGYNYAINYYLFEGIFIKYQRNSSDECINICLNAMFDIYCSIKDNFIIDRKYYSTKPYLVYFLKANNKEEFINFLRNKYDLNLINVPKYQIKLKNLGKNNAK